MEGNIEPVFMITENDSNLMNNNKLLSYWYLNLWKENLHSQYSVIFRVKFSVVILIENHSTFGPNILFVDSI